MKVIQFFRVIGGLVPARVRYCENDGTVVTRASRVDCVQDSVVSRIAPLHGFFTGA